VSENPRPQEELLTKAGKKAFVFTIMAALRAVAIETGSDVKVKTEGAVMDRIHIWIQFSKTPLQVDTENPDFDDLFNRVAVRIRNAVAPNNLPTSLQVSQGFGCDFEYKDPGLELRDAKFSSMKNTRGIVVAEIQTTSSNSAASAMSSSAPAGVPTPNPVQGIAEPLLVASSQTAAPKETREEAQKRMRDELNDLPSFLVDPGAGEVVLKLIELDPCVNRPMGYEIKDFKHMGNAIGWAALANTVTWLTFIVAPFVLHSSPRIVWFAFGATYLVLVLFLKFMIARYVLPCVVHICGPLPHKIEIYGSLLVFHSVVSSSDIITNTACVSEFASPWVWIVWALMLLQPVYVVCMSLGIGTVDHNKTKVPFPWHYKTCPANEQTAVYSTFWESTQTHQGALIALAHGARVHLINHHSAHYLSEFHRKRQTCTSATKALKQNLLRSLVFAIPESVFFVSLKVQALANSLNEGEENPLAMCGAVLGTVTGLAALYHDAYVQWESFKDALEGNHHFWTELDQEGREKKGMAKEKEHMRTAGKYLALQVLVTGACAMSLCQLPLMFFVGLYRT